MKNIKSILSHLFPRNSKFIEHNCFNKLVLLLPKKFKDHTLFCYKKSKTLFFVLDHPGIKMEFNYNLTLINELLNIVKKNSNECKNLNIKNIKVFVSNKKFKKFRPKKTSLSYFKEEAKGEFINCAKDKEIRNIFEDIRKNIKRLKEDSWV